jgi:hypothetical protein
MPPEIKKIPRKRRGKGEVLVDVQILRWRKELKKRGLTTGKRVDADRKLKKRALEKKATEAAILAGKKNFFGTDE